MLHFAGGQLSKLLPRNINGIITITIYTVSLVRFANSLFDVAGSWLQNDTVMGNTVILRYKTAVITVGWVEFHGNTAGTVASVRYYHDNGKASNTVGAVLPRGYLL